MLKNLKKVAPYLIAILVFGTSWNYLKVPVRPKGLCVAVELRSDHTGTHTLYYDEAGTNFVSGRSISQELKLDPNVQTLLFQLPADVEHVNGLRYDPGDELLEHQLKSISIQGPYRSITWDAEEVIHLFRPLRGMETFTMNEKTSRLLLKVNAEDPQFASKVDLQPFVSEVLSARRPVLFPFVMALLIAFLAAGLVHVLLRTTGRRSSKDQGRTSTIQKPSLRTVGVALAIGVVTSVLLNNISFQERRIHVDLEVVATRSDNFQLFFAQKPGLFLDGNYVNRPVTGSQGPQILSFPMPLDTLFSHLRFDPGNAQDSLIVKAMRIRCNEQVKTYDAAAFFDLFKPNEQVGEYAVEERGVVMQFKDNDPFLFCDKNIRPELNAIWERSGNGPLPILFGLLAGLFSLFTLWRRERDRTEERYPTSAWILSGGFLLMLWLPMFSEFMPIQPYLEDTEKRPLAEKPLVRMHSLLDLPAKYTKYYADHFGFRRALFRMNAFFHAYVLHDSSMPDNVIFGKDGFLFLNRPGAIDLYRGMPAFTEEELNTISTRMEERRLWLESQGIRYYLYFPPLKARIYPDKIPDQLQPVTERIGLDLLIDHLRTHTKIPVVDSRKELAEARTVRDTYYTTDMHWNPWGALAGYGTLMATMRKDVPSLGAPCIPEDFIVQELGNDQGDLAMQLAMNDRLTRVTYMMMPIEPWRAVQLPEEDLPASAFFKYKPIFMQGPDPEAPKLLMFRDSFTVYLIPYLSEHFSRSVYVWSPIFIHDIVKKEKPDIVVQEILELFITDLLEDKLHADL